MEVSTCAPLPPVEHVLSQLGGVASTHTYAPMNSFSVGDLTLLLSDVQNIQALAYLPEVQVRIWATTTHLCGVG